MPTVGFTTVRGCGRPVARDVERDAVTAGALTVVGVRVCLVGKVAGVTVLDGVPPVVCFVVTLEPLALVDCEALVVDASKFIAFCNFGISLP